MKKTPQENKEIQEEFYPTSSPDVTVVEGLIKKDEFGFFQNFEDASKLLENSCFRFIPMNNAMAFQEEVTKTGKLNPVHSIVIDFAEVSRIKLVNRETKEVLKEISLI